MKTLLGILIVLLALIALCLHLGLGWWTLAVVVVWAGLPS